MKKTLKLFILLSISFAVLQACKKKEEEEEKPHAIEINEQTKVMPESSRQYIKSLDLENYTFVFDGTDEFINGLEVGNIIVDGISDKAPYGYLRKITAITENKGEKQCQTELVTLPEAVPSGSIDFHTGNLKLSDVKTMKLAKGVKLNTNKDPNFTVFDFTFEKIMVDPHDTNRKVTISGQTALELDFFFNFDWDWDIEACPVLGDPSNGTCLEVSLFETGVEINQSASIAVVSEAGASFEEEITIASFTFQPWVFSVGTVPVVFVPKISLKLNAEGNIVAVFSSSASESLTGRLGVKYENGSFGGINDWNFNKDFVAPQLEVDASAEAHIGPQVSLLLYGAAGPFVNLTACDKFEGTLHTGSGNWDIEFGVGIAAEIGLEVDLLGWEEKFTFNPPDVSGVSNQFCLGYWPLLHLENEPFDNRIYITNPVDNGIVNANTDVSIQTEFTGETPDEVLFFIDGTQVAVDTTEPFEYVWNTTGYALGMHEIIVKEFIAGVQTSSDISNVNLQLLQWVEEDMSAVASISSNYLHFHSIDFKGSNRWISGAYASDETDEDENDTGFLWYSSDNGATWEEVYTYDYDNVTLRGSKINFVNETTGYMIQNRVVDLGGSVWAAPHMFKTTDSGNSFSPVSWYPDSSGDPVTYPFTDFVMNNDGGFVGHAGSGQSNTNSIQVFGQANSMGYLEGPFNTYSTSFNSTVYDIYGKGNTVLAFDYDAGLYSVSNDGGYNWVEKHLPSADYGTSANYFNDISFISEDVAYLSLNGGSGYPDTPLILKTTDAGNTWVIQEEVLSLEGNNNRFHFIHFITEDVGYAWGEERNYNDLLYSGIYKTTDGGHNWSRIYEIPELIPSIINNGAHGRRGGLFFNGNNEGYAVGPTNSHKIYHFKAN